VTRSAHISGNSNRLRRRRNAAESFSQFAKISDRRDGGARSVGGFSAIVYILVLRRCPPANADATLERK
jgi:hypothetical protein